MPWANKTDRQTYNANYYKENRELILAKMAARREANRESYRTYQRDWARAKRAANKNMVDG